MKKKPKVSQLFRCRLTRYTEAVKLLAFKGSKDPETWSAIDKEHATAKRMLMKYVERLEAIRDEAVKRAGA